MYIHVWEAPGWGEGIDGGCSVKKFTISKMTDDYAEGEITVIDAIEAGITFTEPWEASCNQERWIIKRKDDETSFWRDPETENVYFTANSVVNEAIEIFIAERIKVFVETKLERIGPIKMGENDRIKALQEGRLFKVSGSFIFAAQIPDDSVGCSGSRCSNCNNKAAYCNQRCLWCGFPFIGPSGFPQIFEWSSLVLEAKKDLIERVYRSFSSKGRLGYSNVEYVPLTSEDLKLIEELNEEDAKHFSSTHSISHKEIRNTLYE